MYFKLSRFLPNLICLSIFINKVTVCLFVRFSVILLEFWIARHYVVLIKYSFWLCILLGSFLSLIGFCSCQFVMRRNYKLATSTNFCRWGNIRPLIRKKVCNMCLARHVKITLLHLSMKSSQIVLLLIVFMNFRSPIKADEIDKLAKKLKKEKVNIAMAKRRPCPTWWQFLQVSI